MYYFREILQNDHRIPPIWPEISVGFFNHWGFAAWWYVGPGSSCVHQATQRRREPLRTGGKNPHGIWWRCGKGFKPWKSWLGKSKSSLCQWLIWNYTLKRFGITITPPLYTTYVGLVQLVTAQIWKQTWWCFFSNYPVIGGAESVPKNRRRKSPRPWFPLIFHHSIKLFVGSESQRTPVLLVNRVLLLMATRNPVNSPVEDGSLSHYLQGFIHPNGGCLGYLPSTVGFRFFQAPFFLQWDLSGDLKKKDHGGDLNCLPCLETQM